MKIHAAYAASAAHRGQPTVILAHTKKGFGMGSAGQGKMTTHSQKKFDEQDLIDYRNRFDLPLSDEQAKGLAFFKPAADSAEMRYLREHRAHLGGSLPKRETTCERLPVPPITNYALFALQADGKEMSTTMAFVRMLGGLLKDSSLGPRIVPIVADEARTFGMANLFKQVGIYSSVGQRYAPEDIGSVLSYREATDGQILEEGISEAGAIASWTAAATSYSVHGLAMLPFYIYYSMFGLQHQDGSSHLVAATIPNCKAYDPAFAGELAVILDAGMREMVEQQADVFYYVTLMNENYAQPDLPAGVEADVLRGGYRFGVYGPSDAAQRVTLLGSGAILTEVVKAAQQLAAQGVGVEVLSITSWSELARDGMAQADKAGHLAQLLSTTQGPVIAATDYVRAVPESVRAFVPEGRRYTTLGTDGFGRSDTRAALRRFFAVDADSIVQAASRALDA